MEKAATQGHAGAQFSVGLLYGNGDGVKQEYQQAKYWWEKAAIQGEPHAQHMLNVLRQQGY